MEIKHRCWFRNFTEILDKSLKTFDIEITRRLLSDIIDTQKITITLKISNQFIFKLQSIYLIIEVLIIFENIEINEH